MVVFGQTQFYSGKNVEFGIRGCIRLKWLYSGKNGCIREKVVVFRQKGLYSGKGSCIRTKWLYSGKSACI